MNRDTIGREAEDAACRFIKRAGLSIIQRNVHFRGGEIDIVAAQPPDGVIFAEVRFRTSSSHGSAAESINFHKQSRIIHCAKNWIQNHDPGESNWYRFDAICITTGESGHLEIEWIKDAFGI